MRYIFGFISAAAGVYSLLIFIRIIISWFSMSEGSKPVEILGRITDPYLDWWREKMPIKVGTLDFSAAAAIVSLSLVQTIFNMMYAANRISLGSILSVILVSLWSIVSFIIGFFIVVIILRAFAYLTNQNVYSPFWNIVDSVAKPVLYQINRLVFGNKIVNYLTGMIISCLMLAVLLITGRVIVFYIANIFNKLPI